MLESEILTLKGVKRKKSRWTNKTAFFIGHREFAHLHNGREIDVRLSKTYQNKFSDLIQNEKRVRFRENPSHWISIEFTRTSDVDYAFSIVRLALLANLHELRLQRRSSS